MDVVYVCRPGDRNEELRYSLRSLANLPHDRVWVAGAWPRWVRNVECVPTRQLASKYATTTANLLAACRAGVSQRFVFMNDDFFVMRPVETVPVYHKGPITEVAKAHTTLSYGRTMRELGQWLERQGITEPLCYEPHCPIVLDRERVEAMFDLGAPRAAVDAHKRSLYGNVYAIGGERIRDCKVHGGAWNPDAVFLSTTDSSFATDRVGRHIRSVFPEPSPYEEC